MFAMLLLEFCSLNAGPAFGVDVSGQLAAAKFRDRQRAERALISAWPLSAPTLRRTATSQDVDASARATAILDYCRQRDLDSAGQAPWADWPYLTLNGGWDGSRCPPLCRAVRRGLPWVEGYPWNNYRTLSANWARQALDNGCPASLVRIWFHCGRQADQLYERTRPKSEPPKQPPIEID